MEVSLPARSADRGCTHRDYRSQPDGERWELIHGAAWDMGPAPSVNHQRLIEILSPHSTRKDVSAKLALYEEPPAIASAACAGLVEGLPELLCVVRAERG